MNRFSVGAGLIILFCAVCAINSATHPKPHPAHLEPENISARIEYLREYCDALETRVNALEARVYLPPGVRSIDPRTHSASLIPGTLMPASAHPSPATPRPRMSIARQPGTLTQEPGCVIMPDGTVLPADTKLPRFIGTP